jgi:transglutaminase-like putative cysteine protease
MRIEIPWRTLARSMIEILPLAAVLTVALITLNQTRLVVKESEYVTVIVIGLLFGVALARTRFHRWLVVLYCSLLSLFTALEIASDFLSIASARDLGDSFGLIDSMHSQLIFFFDQVVSWWFSYTLGDPIRERAVLVFILGTLLWNLAAWLVWWSLRRRQALIGAIPLGLFLALFVDRWDLSLGYLQSFFFFVFVAHVSTEVTSHYSDWINREIDHPEGLGVEWGISAVVIICFVILSARALPLLATPEGWDTIREWMQREEVVVTAERSAVGEDGGPAKAADSSTPELEIIGDPPASGEAVVMWVQISDPLPLPEGIPGSLESPQHYWRSRIYTTYTGRGWEPLEVVAYSVEPDTDGIPLGRYSLDQTYTLNTTSLDVLYAVNLPYAITDSYGERSLGSDGIIPPAEQGPHPYTIKSWAASPSLSELQAATSSYPMHIVETYLQLPEGLPARVGDLSARLTRGLSNNYDKVKRIETYLRANYTYDLGVSKASPQQDVVDYFLFEAEGGFCSYYASAMVVMLRSINIPARVVSGYAMGSYDPERAAYRVVEGDSHAWVEVYFPELGWIEFEPTAGRASFTHSDQVPAARTADESSVETTPWSRRTLILVVGVAVFLVLAVLIGLWILKRLHRDRYGLQKFGIAGQVYLEMRNILSWIGFHGHPAQTPHEYMHGLEDELASDLAILHSLQQVTEIYTHVRFGGFNLSEDGVQDLQRMWKQNKWAWMSFSLRHQILALRLHFMDRIHQFNVRFHGSPIR